MKKRYEFAYLKYIIEKNRDLFDIHLQVRNPSRKVQALFEKGQESDKNLKERVLAGGAAESELFGGLIGFFGYLSGGQTRDNIKLITDKSIFLAPFTYNSALNRTSGILYNKQNGDEKIVFTNNKNETFNYYFDSKRTLHKEEYDSYICGLIELDDVKSMHNLGEDGIHIFCCANKNLSKLYFVDSEALYKAWYIENKIPTVAIANHEEENEENLRIRPWKLTDDIVFSIIR